LKPAICFYIPPGVAHWGISQGNSLCLSVGFRAPAYHEILQQWADDLADQLDESLRYRDPLTESLSRHELSASNLRNLHQLLTEQLTPESLAAATAKLVSEPKYNHPIEPIMPATDDEPLYKAADARLLLCNDMLYANGEALACSAKLPRPLLLSLCNDDMIDSSMRQTLLANTEGQAFLQTLLALGVFEVDDDDFQ
jgi:50S ribosomal protein L16 3-hydroxylase